ncbi:MAG: protein translocase subunit SecF [Rickettsiales bacterium]|nr:protein translocase subunit SecF [Rickettsiales bacterium]|tara:strand:- start:104378 stop:105289 length:912 start_codon:yes stop_codon:yes gene_type:complete
MLLRYMPLTFNFNIIKLRYVSFAFSLLLVIASAAFYGLKNFNYGIDFKGGVMIEVRSTTPIELSTVRSELNALNIGDVSVQEFGSPNDLLIKFEQQKDGIEGKNQALEKIEQKFKNQFEIRRTETVGPKQGKELIQNGILAILYGLLAILIYIWFRFEWQFGLCAVIALLQNALVVFGYYSVFQVEFNTTAIVAVLTTIGYTINDTVVIYDRIRENLRKYKKKAIPDLINLSINETLSRTLMTSGTTLVALFSLYFFGGEVIASYSLPIIVGVVIGTYSSILIAGPLLLNFNLRQLQKEEDTP